ncbi:sorting nexin-24-like [Chiloscyllium plagiosum]|uniref:sorting nexin-24-like n=1 Tax=Chiloscyllium plagiosum TaxID=36176 RepID=UPI001CB801B1|nr:sorting nexin-24-like [Chiloscyllium plagiosum]
MIQVRIPSIGQGASGDSEKVHTVFRVEVLNNGRKHLVDRRYRDFQALHKKLKKTTKTPDFPSKRGLNRRPKALEQKRSGLEAYLQSLVCECDNWTLSREILDFLNIKHIPVGKSPNTVSALDQLDLQNYRFFCHQVVSFTKDAFSQPNPAGLLPNVIVMGVLQGLYLTEPDSEIHSGAGSPGTMKLHIPGPESFV